MVFSCFAVYVLANNTPGWPIFWVVYGRQIFQDNFDPSPTNQLCIKIGKSSKLFMHDCPVPMCASCAVAYIQGCESSALSWFQHFVCFLKYPKCAFSCVFRQFFFFFFFLPANVLFKLPFTPLHIASCKSVLCTRSNSKRGTTVYSCGQWTAEIEKHWTLSKKIIPKTFSCLNA